MSKTFQEHNNKTSAKRAGQQLKELFDSKQAAEERVKELESQIREMKEKMMIVNRMMEEEMEEERVGVHQTRS